MGGKGGGTRTGMFRLYCNMTELPGEQQLMTSPKKSGLT